jgi:hypothetical protein
MRWQTTAVLAVLLAILGAFYYVYEVRMAPDREKVEAQKGRVFTVEMNDVTELSIERPNDTVRVKREADGWQLLWPTKARADRAIVDDVLTTMVTTRSDRQIVATPSPTQVAEFGLDKPAARVTLALKDGSRREIALGAKSPTGTWVYAREAQKPAVIVVGDSMLRDATRSAADFRDKTVLAFDRRELTGLEIATRDDTIAFATDGAKWSLTKPRALPADADVVRDFLEKLSAARVKEFLAESPPSLAPWDLDKPTRVTLVTGKDKDRATKTLLLGRLDVQKKGMYAVREGEPSVLLIPEEVWTALPRTVATARDKTVVDFERDKIATINLASPKGAVTLTKEGDRWRITGPEALPADQVEAGAILFKLRELKAQAFLSEDASLVPRLLARPTVKVTVADPGGESKTLLLAPSEEKRGGAPSAYAGLAERGPVVLVDAKVLTDLSRSLTDLRDHTVLAGFEPKEIQRVLMKASGKSVLLEKSGDEWKLLEPSKGAAKAQKVEDVLYMLRALRWKEIAEPAPAATYGFDQPTFEVALYRPDGTEIGTVILGKREADRAWVKMKASPTVFTVDPKLLGELPKIPDDVKG